MELAPGWIQYTAGNRVLSGMIDLQMNDGSRQFNVRIEQRDSILHPNVVAYRSHFGVPQPVTLIEARKAILELFESQGEYYATDEVALDTVADYLNQQVAVAITDIDAARHENDILRIENAKLRKYVESALCDRVGDLVKSERANLDLDLIVTVAIQ